MHRSISLQRDSPCIIVDGFVQVPGAGNRITLIDTAAIVPGSLSNKGANGGVIAGLRSEMTRPFISLGPGGVCPTPYCLPLPLLTCAQPVRVGLVGPMVCVLTLALVK